MPQDAAAELCIDSLAQGGKFMCGISRIKQEKSLHLGLEIVDFFFVTENCSTYQRRSLVFLIYLLMFVFLHKFAVNGEMIA